MRKFLITSLTVVSLLLCVAAGWCWHRSYAFADIISRDSFGESYNLLQGVGSYRGAFIVGSLKMPKIFPPRLEINRRVYVVSEQKDRVKTALAGRRGALGFGIADGTVQLPVLGAFFKTPPLPYHIVFIPYYFIILLAAILPAWRGVLFLRRTKTPAERTFRTTEPATA